MIAEADARAWIEAYGDAWTTRDPDKIVKLFTADASYQERRFHAPLRGAGPIRNYWQMLVHDLQRDVAFDVEQIVVSGNQAFVHWTAHFTWRPINGIFELDTVSRVTFSDETLSGLRLVSSFEEWINSREG